MNLLFLLFSNFYLWNGISFWANRLEPPNHIFDRGNFLRIGLEFEPAQNYSIGINANMRNNVFIQHLSLQSDSEAPVPKHASDFLFITEISRSFLKNKNLRFSLGFGSFTYNGPPFTNPNRYIGSYTQYILTPSLQYRKRIRKTNLLLGLTFQYFYTFKRLKESYPLEGFALFFDIGAVIRE